MLVRLPPDVPNGPWTVEVHLQSGTLTRTATGRLSFPNPGEEGNAFLAGMTSPWGLGGSSLAIGALLAVGVTIFTRRRRRGVATAETGGTDAGGKTDT